MYINTGISGFIPMKRQVEPNIEEFQVDKGL
jgi:hypothetical protein